MSNSFTKIVVARSGFKWHWVILDLNRCVGEGYEKTQNLAKKAAVRDRNNYLAFQNKQ